jgi:hypothetical protein
MTMFRRLIASAKRICGCTPRPTLKLHRVKLTKAKFAAIPASERSLLLLLGHASNEITVLSKLILMVRKDEAPIPQFVDHVEAGQIFIIMRILIGKLHEAWLLFGTRVQADPNMRSYISDLPPRAVTALQKLNKHFGKGSPLTDIRNQVSFHYKDEDDLVEGNFHKLGDSEPCEFYLANTIGNTFYLGSETVIARSVIDLMKPTPAPDVAPGDLSQEAKAFKRLCDIVISVSGELPELFGPIMAEIISKYTDSEMDIVEVPNVPKLSKSCLHYFHDEDDFLPSGGTK